MVLMSVRGRGGHGSMPHFAKDPVPVACEMVLALQNFITRNVPVFDPAVLTVGLLRAGTLQNIIPETAEFTATVRSFSVATQRILREGARRVCEGIAAAHGLEGDAQYVEIYPPTVNDAVEAEFAAGTVRGLLGDARYRPMPNPMPASEDFSRVLAEVPGAMIMLGACPPDADPLDAPMNHSPYARYDDGVLPDGAAVLAELALRRLAA
ncbi:MAG: M20/M25/M40 family metallo-hydrolase [Streptosporangiales bacterium]|nr:M20/M25/M40 family metallo-hydrolase [Streptosporangiales bacterium]